MFRRSLASPVFGKNDEKARAAFFLQVISLSVSLLFGILAVSMPFVLPSFDIRLTLCITICVMSTGVLILARFDYIKLGSILLIVVLWSGFTIALVIVGGVRTPAFAAYSVITLVAGFLLGRRVCVLVASASILAGAAMLYAETAQFVHYSLENIGPFGAFMIQAVFLVTVTIIFFLHTWNVDRSSDALRVSEQRYRAVAEDTPVLLCRFQPDGTIDFVNQAHCRYFRKAPEELVGSSFFSLFPTEHEQVMRIGIEMMTIDSPTHWQECPVNVTPSEIHWLRWTSHAIFDSGGKLASYQAIGEDITARKRVEEEKRTMEAELRHAQKMDAIGQLASGVAHEFNNLLVGIRSNSEILKLTSSDVLSEQSLVLLNDIERAGSRAHDLTNRLLSFSRKKGPDVTVFDVNRVVRDSERMFQKLLGSDIDLNYVTAPDPAFVCANDGEIEQALLNLLLNARDATPDGGAVTIRTCVVTLGGRDVPEDCEDGIYVRLSVSDNGCGMSPETRERIFEPFFTTKDASKGTGLGLTVAYADVSKSGGFLTVDSREGVGTDISIFLPRTQLSVVEAASAETPSPITGSVGGEETILVCDDEQIVMSSVVILLQVMGYSVLSVDNAADAIAVAEKYEGMISLLLTDVSMPAMNGIELGREIRRTHPKIKILYTSGNDAAHLVTSDDVGFHQKGGACGELLEKVRQLLDRKNYPV